MKNFLIMLVTFGICILMLPFVADLGRSIGEQIGQYILVFAPKTIEDQIAFLIFVISGLFMISVIYFIESKPKKNENE